MGGATEGSGILYSLLYEVRRIIFSFNSSLYFFQRIYVNNINPIDNSATTEEIDANTKLIFSSTMTAIVVPINTKTIHAPSTVLYNH